MLLSWQINKELFGRDSPPQSGGPAGTAPRPALSRRRHDRHDDTGHGEQRDDPGSEPRLGHENQAEVAHTRFRTDSWRGDWPCTRAARAATLPTASRRAQREAGSYGQAASDATDRLLFGRAPPLQDIRRRCRHPARRTSAAGGAVTRVAAPGSRLVVASPRLRFHGCDPRGAISRLQALDRNVMVAIPWWRPWGRKPRVAAQDSNLMVAGPRPLSWGRWRAVALPYAGTSRAGRSEMTRQRGELRPHARSAKYRIATAAPRGVSPSPASATDRPPDSR